MRVQIVKNVTKEYPEMYKVLIYKQPRVFISSDAPKRKKEIVSDEEYTPAISSLNRTKTLVKDIVLCNDFELFCTFTFDPKKIDRFNLYQCWGKMSRWLHHQKERANSFGSDFKYLIIPEQHKSGAWHFHALISGYKGSLHDSGLCSASLRPIYNITSFRSGFTTAVEIDSKEGVSSYITKYITKDFITTFNQRRFFCSRNLTRPTKVINSSVFRNTLPLFRIQTGNSLDTEEYLLPKMDFKEKNITSLVSLPIKYH